jgi:hypothetical protein
LTLRPAARGTLLVLAGVAAAYAFGPLRFTWRNSGLLVDHPPAQAAAAVAGAVLLGAAAFRARPPFLPIVGGAVAFGLCVLGAERLVWRLEAVDAGLSERTALGSTRMGWKEIASVNLQPDALVLRARNGATLFVVTRSYPAEQRSRLERTIARRVREASLR